MGEDRGRRTAGRKQGTRNEVGRFGLDDYYREYYDLYDMDWEVIKETTKRDLQTGILRDKIAALGFLSFGIALAIFAWAFHDFSVREFGPFEWIVGLGGLCLGIGGCIHTWNSARWREAVIRRNENASRLPEPGLEREGVSKPSYF